MIDVNTYTCTDTLVYVALCYFLDEIIKLRGVQ